MRSKLWRILALLMALAPTIAELSGGRVNLRSGPSTGEQVMAVLTRGTPVFAEGSDQQWTLVRTMHGRIGWVHSSLLEHP